MKVFCCETLAFYLFTKLFYGETRAFGLLWEFSEWGAMAFELFTKAFWARTLALELFTKVSREVLEQFASTFGMFPTPF